MSNLCEGLVEKVDAVEVTGVNNPETSVHEVPLFEP